MWRCPDCGRTYDQPPAACVCGTARLDPGGDHRDERYSMLALRERLFQPQSADRSLIREEPYITVVFRVMLCLAFFAAIFLGVLLLV